MTMMKKKEEEEKKVAEVSRGQCEMCSNEIASISV